MQSSLSTHFHNLAHLAVVSPVKIAKIGKAYANQANCIRFEANISLDPILKNHKNRIKNQPWSFSE
jgi:hypothetical protein